MKRVTKIRVILAIAVLLVAVAAWIAFRPNPYPRHFASPLPDTARLLHYERFHFGFDVSHAFVFEVSDDQLLTQLIREWSLAPASAAAGEPTSFVALRGPAWWPAEPSLEALPERYGWLDSAQERYRSVWVDRTHRQVFAEYGCW